MSIKKVIYVVLAVCGVLFPWYFNFEFMRQTGTGLLDFDLAGFVAGSYANPAASSLTVDLSVACLTFAVWMVVEARKLGMKHWWVYLVITFGVAFACAFPLFLLMRDKRLEELAEGRAGDLSPRADQ